MLEIRFTAQIVQTYILFETLLCLIVLFKYLFQQILKQQFIFNIMYINKSMANLTKKLIIFIMIHFKMKIE